jgi:hypothetical protein
VPFADGDFVDANGLGPRLSSSTFLLPHVVLFQLLDGVPIEFQLLGHGLNRRGAAAAADVVAETLGVEGVVRQKGEFLLLHHLAALAKYPPDFQLEVDPAVTAGKVPYPANLAVVEAAVFFAAGATRRFF